MIRWAAACAVVAGAGAGSACSDDPGIAIAPVVDIPIVGDTDARAAPLDSIQLAIAHTGLDRDLVTQSFTRGAPLELPGVPFGDDLVMHMSGFVGQSNVAYGRTCTFSVAPGAVGETPHLFFSRSTKFASFDMLPKLPMAATGVVSPLTRVGGLGVGYLGGAVFIGGLDPVGNPVTTVERYDPVTNVLDTIGTTLPRSHAVQALVGNPPRIVVVGGESERDTARFIEVIDGLTVGQMDFASSGRTALTATTLVDGRVIVIGGNVLDQPATDEIDEIDATLAVRKLGAKLAQPRTGHTATRLGDDVGAPVLIAGGVNAASVPIARAELFKPLSDELASPLTFKPDMQVPRRDHVALLLPDESVLIIGGVDALNQPVRTLERFTIDAGFTMVGDLPADAGIVDFTATSLPDGRILLAGGRTTPNTMTSTVPPTNTAYIIRLDPLNGQIDVVATDHLSSMRAGHQAALMCDGSVLISGGTLVPLQAERYNPPPAGRR